MTDTLFVVDAGLIVGLSPHTCRLGSPLMVRVSSIHATRNEANEAAARRALEGGE